MFMMLTKYSVVDDHDEYVCSQHDGENRTAQDAVADVDVADGVKHSEHSTCDDVLHSTFDDVITVITKTDVNKASTDDEWCVKLSVLGKPLPVEIDTGAKCNILSLSMLQSLKVPFELSAKMF